MIILSQETEALARRLAETRGRSLEEVVADAIRAEAKSAGMDISVGRARMNSREILAVGDEIAAMPVLDPRSPNEIMDDLNSI